MRNILAICLCSIFFSCNQSQTVSKAGFDLEPVKSHIREMNKTYSNRFMSNDTSFYIERYCADAMVMCPNLETVKGREAIQKFFYNEGNNTDTHIELPEGNIYGNDDLVIEEGLYNFPDGKGGSVDKGKFIAIWKQEDGKWKLYREIWNTDMPPSVSQ